MATIGRIRPGFVAKKGEIWAWECRLCSRYEWAPKYSWAMEQFHYHLKYSHHKFGFGVKGEK